MYGYGEKLINELQEQSDRAEKSIDQRARRIAEGETDIDDCFVSQNTEYLIISEDKLKIDLIKDGGTAWFTEAATLDGKLLKSRWINTRYGARFLVEREDGTTFMTSSQNPKVLAKRGIKLVSVKRPAWYELRCNRAASGMYGAYTARPVLVPSCYNYATGQTVDQPLEVKEWEG